MATLTDAQRKAIISKGLQPATFERMDQAKVDKYFPPDVTAPAPTAPGGKSKTPVSQPVKAPTSLPALPPSPAFRVVPESEPEPDLGPFYGTMPVEQKPVIPVPTSPVYPFAPPVVPDIARQVRTGPSLTELANRYVQSRSLTPEGSIDPELEKEARARAERILQTKFTAGGEQQPITAPFVSESADKTSILEALKPQRIATPEQSVQIKDIEYRSSLEAVDQLAKEYDRDIATATGKELEELKNKRILLDENPLGSSDFLTRKRDLVEYRNKEAQALAEGKTIPPFKADYKDPSIFSKTTAAVEQVMGEVASKAFISEDAGTGIVETPVGYVGRLLGSPVSAIIGGVKGAVGPDTIKAEVAKSIREGDAVMTVGKDIADAASEAAGLPPDSEIAKGARWLGGGAGLIIDFLLPVVPGYGSARAGIKAGIQTAKIGEAMATPTATVAKAVAWNAVKAAGGEAAKAVPFSSKYISPEYGQDIYSGALTRFATDEANLRTMENIIDVGNDLPPGFDKLEYGAKKDWLETYWDTNLRYGNETFDEFQARTAKVADIYDPATYTSLKRSQPQVLKRATIDDALPPEAKARIARRSPFTSSELTKELVDFANRNNIDVEDILKKPFIDNNYLLDTLLGNIYGGDNRLLIRDAGALKHHLLNIGNEKTN